MLELEKKVTLRNSLTRRLCQARVQTDALFDLLREDALYDRPIPERNRIIFYLGHFEAFDWNIICRNALGMESFNQGYDDLFAFGIDPVGGELPSDQPRDWPGVAEVRRYCRRVRAEVDRALSEADFDNPALPHLRHGKAFHVAIEHRLMHAETLAYMYHWLPFEKKNSQPFAPPPPPGPVRHREVEIPAGRATLGAEEPSESVFGWDNEFRRHTVDVPAFSVDSHNVTNGDYLDFMGDGGYERKEFWTENDWEWRKAAGVRHPRFWSQQENEWSYTCMFEEISLPFDWPIYVSHAEASAYARWKGKALPTEAQFHRAAYGTPEGGERAFPWGNQEPDGARGNFGFRRWDPVAVGSYPEGDSAFGLSDLAGNGWEWTSTIFGPFEGFEVFPFYPRYSKFFFDDKHFVVKGGSPRTDHALLRRSYRNWFQARYPYIYSTFRLVRISN